MGSHQPEGDVLRMKQQEAGPSVSDSPQPSVCVFTLSAGVDEQQDADSQDSTVTVALVTAVGFAA